MYGKYNFGIYHMDKILKILNNKFEPGDRELFWNNKKFTAISIGFKKLLFRKKIQIKKELLGTKMKFAVSLR